MAKIGKSKQQYVKNRKWLQWYWTSIFQRLNNRKPSNDEIEHLNEILTKSRPSELYEWGSVYHHIHKNNDRLNIRLWSKSFPSYQDNSIGYIVNHATGIIYIIDKTNETWPPKEALLNNSYSIYQNKFTFQQYVDNKIKKDSRPGASKLVGRAINSIQSLYVKKIIGNNQIIKWNKKNFAVFVNTRANNLPYYYDKPRGHKGYWISLNLESSVFKNPKLPKYGHYTN
ncbi:MAG: hypothetical protein LBJ97_01505 [Mycoplasmataceae bacterium]|jgi:hypothetical protein|nr:hypothetical protein [Mycoplasmataceae bacterium]